MECANPILDVYGICETFLTDSVHDKVVNVQGYQIIWKDRVYCKGGGLILYIKDGITYKCRRDLESQTDKTIEIIWLELKLANKSLLIAQVYRPPSFDNILIQNWLEYVENSLWACILRK